MAVITKIKPLPEPKVMPERENFDMKPAPAVVWFGTAVIAVTVLLYIIFW